MTSVKRLILTCGCLSWVLFQAGCAAPDRRPELVAVTGTEAQRIQDAAPQSKVTRRTAPYTQARTVDYLAPSTDGVSLSVANADFAGTLEAIARPKGYGVVVAKNLAPSKVSLEFANLPFDRAVREIAAAAGVAVVIDRQRKAVYAASEATYTYRVPAHLFDDLTMSYSVSSNPAMTGNNGGGAGQGNPGSDAGASAATYNVGGGSSGGPSANNTNMRVSGTTRSALASFEKALRELAGEKASVTLLPETGLVAVRGDASALKRVGGFLEAFAQDVGRQIEVRAALVEVTLGDQFAYGLDWRRILNKSSRTIDIGFTTSNLVQNAVVNGQVTTKSVTAVVKALESETAVKVVAEPQLWMLNHQPGIVFNATQRPYLGSVSNTVSGNASIQTTSGSLSYVMDGVSLAFKPNILDDAHTELTVIPVLSTATNERTFQPGNGLQLTGFDLPTSSTHMKLLLESGKTYIVGGSRFTSHNYQRDGIPGNKRAGVLGDLLSGTNDSKSSKELVLLLSTHVIPAPAGMNIVISEAL